MREILFRGKGDTKYNDGDWYEGFLIKDDDGDYQIFFCGGIRRTVVSETVGQYTGLTDRNGVKIFEGDIVKDTNDNELLVVEGDTLLGFDFRYIDGEDNAYTTAYDIGLSDDYTYLMSAVVVGNIYDNPELLEVEQ